MKLSIAIFIILLSFSSFAQHNDTVNIYFPLNSATITQEGNHVVDSIIQHHIFIPGIKLAILGYCDYVGGDKYNDSLSTARAQHVMDYLLTKGFKKEDIRLCIGKGKIDRTPVNGNDGYPADRRVSIIKDETEKTEIDKLPEVKLNDKITIAIYFISSTHKIIKESLPVLSNLYRVMKNNPKLKIRIEGHICCMEFNKLGTGGGGEPINNTFDKQLRLDGYDTFEPGHGAYLSSNRAKVVYQFLIDNGINANRVSYIGLGESKTEADAEKSEEDRRLNRRIDIRVLDK